MERLFVYGSLKRGFVHYRQLAGAIFEDEVETAPGYALYVVGEYPAMVSGGTARVRGELFRVDEARLGVLDAFEGCPTLYQRETVRLADGRSALAYVMSSVAVVGLPRVRGGIWLPSAIRLEQPWARRPPVNVA